MLRTPISNELAEAVELVEKLKKLPPLEQTFLKGYIEGMLAKLGECKELAEQQKPA